MAGFSSFQKIVEFGCGPGFTACELAQEISPHADVCAIDYSDMYLQCGGTTEVGSILPDALVRAGFEIKQIQCVGGLAESGSPKFKWWKRLNEDFNQSFREKGLLSVEQEAKIKKFWQVNSDNANAFIYTPILVQLEAVKP